MLTQTIPLLIDQKRAQQPLASSEMQDRYRDVPLGVECAWPAALPVFMTEAIRTAA